MVGWHNQWTMRQRNRVDFHQSLRQKGAGISFFRWSFTALPQGIVSDSPWKELGMDNFCFSSRFNLLFVFEKFTTQTCISKDTSNDCWKKSKIRKQLATNCFNVNINYNVKLYNGGINKWKFFGKTGTYDILFSSEIYWYRKGSVLPIHWDGGACLHEFPHPLQNPCTRHLMFIYDTGYAQLKDASSQLGSRITSVLWMALVVFWKVPLCWSRHTSLYPTVRWYLYFHSYTCD